MNFIKKPFVALVVMVLVAAAIIFVEMQKPNVNFANNSTLEGKNSQYQKAPDFIGISRWINSEPLKVESLKGKIVLVDFWTYTCINCIRTLPYLKDWDAKYRDKGLVIVGVHTPEFEFEKDYNNVLKAVNDNSIKYAVAQDNYYATWQSYQNRYWPHKFLIDIYGRVRYDHIGEGGYEETEQMIQELLKERMEKLGEKGDVDLETSKPLDAANTSSMRIGTPEIYLGYQFSRGNFGNPEGFGQDTVIDYKIPSKISGNNVYLEGKWKSNADNMELLSDTGDILLVFDAKSVNIVAGSESKSEASVFLDNKKQNPQNISEFKLYNLANADEYKEHLLKATIKGKGFKLYTFTFG